MNTCISKQNIIQVLQNIMKKRFNIDHIEGVEFDKDLLGLNYRLQARDLLYIFFDIEKEFGINIPEKDIIEGRFNTINNIADIIYETIHMKVQ